MDKVRQITDKRLAKIKKNIAGIYKNDPQLKKAKKKYSAYMDIVRERTKSEYEAFINETDRKTKAELKEAYISILKELTANSKEYKAVVKNYIKVLSSVNQKALNVVNNKTAIIYAENYNQMADECRKLGIPVK